MRRILTVLVLITAVGCASSGDGEASRDDTTTTARATTSTTEATTSSSTVTASCTADDADPGELEHLVVDEVAGFQVQAPYVGDTGPSDLLKAIGDDGEPDARQVLTDLRYRRGYQRLWGNEFREEVVLFLYEFCDAAGADGYRARTRDLVAASGIEPQPFATEAGMSGFSIEAEDVVAAFVSATVGAQLVHVIAYARGGSDLAEVQTRATDLVAAQLARL